MTQFLNKSGKLTEIKETPFKLERDMQRLFEHNIALITGLQMVKSEFTIKNKRIDTLAFDKNANAFVIIEFKRDKNTSVIDQGFAYLSLMLENKADFVLEYNESQRENIKRDNVDWSQTRVMFVSQAFTENQILSTNFKDLAIELWEIKRYENSTISLKQIKKTASAVSIKPITQQNTQLKKVIEEIKVYTEQDLLAKASDPVVELYERFKESITNLSGDIEVYPTKVYVGFKTNKTIVGIEILRNSLKIAISAKWGSLDDPKAIAKNVSNIGHRCYGDYQIQVEDDKNLEYIMSLVKQVL